MKYLLWKGYSVTPSQYMIQLKRIIFHYFEVKIQLLLISLNSKLLFFKLNALYMEACVLHANLGTEILTTFLCMKIICTLPSISEYGNLRKCLTKFDFLVCLNGLADLIYDPPYVEMKVIDGAAFFKMNPPTTSNTYGEHCDTEQKAKV